MLTFLVERAAELARAYGVVVGNFLLACFAFTLLERFFSGQALDPARRWWNNRGAVIDLLFLGVNPLLGSVLRFVPFALILLVVSFWMSPMQLRDFIAEVRGPLAQAPFALQCLIVLVALDFYHYWMHRLSHKRPLWRLHIVHHAAEDVQWTTAYRVHPLSLMIEATFPITMLLLAGASPGAAALAVQTMTLWSFFVHANLNWTLGPLRYVLTSPVFHRRHHAANGQRVNFGAVFSVWDAAFKTGALPHDAPARFGIDDATFPAGFLGQLVFPFKI